ncbi:MAG: hypothetical protein ACRDI2_06940 [Chloroflexota bacterium]
MAQATTSDESLSASEIEQRYPDEWVIMEITKEHKHPRKVKGRLIAHSANRDELDEPFHRFRTEHPQAHTYEFFTGEILPKDFDGVIVL